MKKDAGIEKLPLRPEPFVFRLELSPEAAWAPRLLQEISSSASVIQIEVAGPLTEAALRLLKQLDDAREPFSLRLLVGADGGNVGKCFDPLSRLKKLTALMFLMKAPVEEASVAKLKELLAAAASSGLKPGVLIELSPSASLSDLKHFILDVRRAGALEISLRPSIPDLINSNNSNFGDEPADFLAELKNTGLPVFLEECFPGHTAASTSGLNPDSVTFELNCRRGFGCCYVDRQGLVKVCRQSDRVLGDLARRSPEDIWKEFLYARNICPLSELRRSQNDFGEDNNPQKNEKANKINNNEDRATPESDRPEPINLDSSLRPVPLFTLKEKSWGALLIKGLDGVVLSPRGAEMAAFIDGQKDLKLLRKKYGSRGVQFVLALFLKGLVRLEK